LLNEFDPIYRCIAADPPWTPELGSTWKTRFTDKARPQKHYETMSLEEITALVIPAAKQAHLWLWCIGAHVDWGYQVARAWGFKPVKLFAWCKSGLGTGQFQDNTEYFLACRKGSRHNNPFGHTGGTHFNWPRGRHSEKPDEFYHLVMSVSPGPYFEMFARRCRSDWTVWGNEVGSREG